VKWLTCVVVPLPIYVIIYSGFLNIPNIGLTFKAWPELLRGIGALFALLFCKKRDKRLYKVEAGVSHLFLYIPMLHFF